MKIRILTVAVLGTLAASAQADQVIPDDLIVQGSVCVGFDCANNESFGFDTIRLKENNTRIKFEDTSVGTFPSTDWQLTANDSASGGANKFSIEDVTSAKVPFTIRGGAPTNSIFVDSSGRVGLGTSTPVLDVHVASNNTPAMRLEQDSSGGFTAQTWDIGGNEANFFVRDVTGGSKLSFRIRPGAPTSSIDIASSGNVGIATASPSEALHVKGSDADTTILVEETNATVADRQLLNLTNTGGARFDLTNTSNGVTWRIGSEHISQNFIVTKTGTGSIEMELDGSGNLAIHGTLSQGSDVNSKTSIAPVNAKSVLDKVLDLPIAEWSYKTDADGTRHMGPMAQDFAALFGLGNDERKISTLDTSGVALASIQALAQEIQARDSQIQSLQANNAALQERLERLEYRLNLQQTAY